MPLLHGSYVRIQIPPSLEYGIDTCRAASLVETVSDLSAPTFADMYPLLQSHQTVNVRADTSSSGVPSPSMSDCFGTLGRTLPRQCHLGDDQSVAAPEFEAPIPSQPIFAAPNIPDWTSFEQAFQPLFEEHSTIEIPDKGPILHAITWFIHHDRSPVCLVGRLVRLSHRPLEWPALLCAPWLPQIQPFQNLALHLVRPTPTADFLGQRVVHVILEQGLQVGRMTGLFSALIEGMHGDITHRRAQSIPSQLSVSVITRILDMVDWCQARRCSAWSGRIPFQRHNLDHVYSGIGVCVTVKPFSNRFAHVDDDGYPMPAASSAGPSAPSHVIQG